MARSLNLVICFLPSFRPKFFTTTSESIHAQSVRICEASWRSFISAGRNYTSPSRGLKLPEQAHRREYTSSTGNTRPPLRLLDIAREFSRNAKELGIKIHGTFILGLPGETTSTIQQTIKIK